MRDMEEFNAIEYLRELADITKDMADDERQEFYNNDLEKLSEKEFAEVMEILEAEDCDCEKSERMEELECYEKELDIKATEIALEDEVRRVEKFEKEPNIEGIEDTLYFKKGMLEAKTFVAMAKELINQGFDYNNSVAICNNFIQNEHNLELSKYGQVTQQQNQI